jgi:hypothetical protein
MGLGFDLIGDHYKYAKMVRHNFLIIILIINSTLSIVLFQYTLAFYSYLAECQQLAKANDSPLLLNGVKLIFSPC